MRGNEGRWLAPSATPWDDAGEKSLGPAETLVMACHRDLHGYRHAGASLEGEADFFNAYVRDACPRRGSREAGGDGRDRNDARRWRCRSRERSLGVATGAMSGSHRMPAADRAEFLLEMLSCESLKGIARSNRRSETTPPYWLAKLFAVLAGTRDCVVLSGNVWIDERCHPLSGKDQRRKADGTKPRGLSGSQICIAIGCDGKGRSFFSRLGLGKPSESGARAAYAGHIQRGSHLIHDMERSHKVLVRESGLTEEAHDPRRTRTLPDKENPPHGASEPCYLPGLFPSSHSGFDRARLEGYLDLFHVMMNPPDEKMEKAACALDRAMRFPHALRYREYYRKKTSSKEIQSSWEPTTSKGEFLAINPLLQKVGNPIASVSRGHPP